MSENLVLAVGDVQGNMQRLEALLLQEGIIGSCGVCAGTGDVSDNETGPAEFCPNCKGSGTARIRRDVTVVQLGDLVDARFDTRSADSLCVEFADQWVDVVLWGNHDRPVVDPRPEIMFGGYCTPLLETVHRMRLMMQEGRYRMAYAAHGFLLVHAGLPKSFKQTLLPAAVDRDDPVELAFYFNAADAVTSGRDCDFINADGDPYEVTDRELEAFEDLRDAIGPMRGGWHNHGGLLWRDASEKLYPGVRQVFGHSSKENVRKYQCKDGWSYCTDLSKHGGIGAIWLPDERIVELRLGS